MKMTQNRPTSAAKVSTRMMHALHRRGWLGRLSGTTLGQTTGSPSIFASWIMAFVIGLFTTFWNGVIQEVIGRVFLPR